MTKTRKITATVCIIIWVLLCGYKVFSYFKEKHMHEQAYSNAQRNISEKYGFDFELYETDWDKSANPTCAKGGWMWLTAKHDGREFQVMSSCLAEDPVSLDDYQYDEIKSALLDEVSKELTGGEYVDCVLSQTIPWETLFRSQVFHTFYDGTNLDKVLENCSGNLTAVFADTDFSDMKIGERLQKLNIDFEFTSFDTEEHMEEFLRYPTDSGYFDEYYRFKMFAPYITDRYEAINGEVKRLDIKLQEYGDFMYSYFPDRGDFPVSKDMPVTERIFKTGIISEMYEYNGEGEYISKPLTNEYHFDCRHGDIYVYYPLDALKKYGLEPKDIGAAWFSRGGGWRYAGVEKMSVCGDYAVFRLPNEDMFFALVDASGFDKYVPGGKQTNDNAE